MNPSPTMKTMRFHQNIKKKERERRIIEMKKQWNASVRSELMG
jgi:hypothetical protein